MTEEQCFSLHDAIVSQVYFSLAHFRGYTLLNKQKLLLTTDT